jgi:cobalt/nickel transport system ATP-binding protein
VVTATHDLDIVEVIADRALVLANGRIAAEGKPSEILADVSMLHQTHLTHTHRHSHGGGRDHSHHHLHR